MLDKILNLGNPDKKADEPVVEFRQNKKYRLCVEDNPNERTYRCGKGDICKPACRISLVLEELTHEEALKIEEQLRILLRVHEFVLR